MPRKTAPKDPADNSRRLDQSELKKHLGYFLARARFIAFRNFHQHIGEAFELKPVEFAMLVLLGSNEDVTQKQLSRELGVAQPNMTGILRRLEERGVVERTRAKHDLRMQYITLTTAGQKLLRQSAAAGKGMDDRWLANLTPGERGMLVELLEKVAMRVPEEA